MIPKYRAWYKEWKEMGRVGEIRFDLDGSVSVVLFKGNYLDVNEPREKIILMQSTGLHDKNGKEIFEGDILGTKDGFLNGVVEYRTDLGMWTNSLVRYNNFERLCSIASDRKIIGNIYENPELLEVKR
nr:MAG TPA: YopX protein [Caudoviricetes sp.]